MSPKLHQIAIPTEVLRRGFWLYVWQINLRGGTAVYYVGRTGDSSSLKAQSPFSRVSGHLGPNKHANALRRHLSKNGISFDDCEGLELVTYGPLYEEADNRADHRDRRDKTHALESELCRAMAKKYKVLGRPIGDCGGLPSRGPSKGYGRENNADYVQTTGSRRAANGPLRSPRRTQPVADESSSVP
jgi:hypothetical protein